MSAASAAVVHQRQTVANVMTSAIESKSSSVALHQHYQRNKRNSGA